MLQCYWITMSHAPHFCCSVNRNCAAAQEWSIITNHAHSPRRTETTICMRVQAVRILLYAENLYAIHYQFCHTALLRNIFCGQDPSASLLASLWDCMLFRLLTSDPGSLVARPSRKPYTTKVVFWANFFHQFLTLCLAVKPYRPVFWCGRCDLLLYCMERQWCA